MEVIVGLYESNNSAVFCRDSAASCWIRSSFWIVSAVSLRRSLWSSNSSRLLQYTCIYTYILFYSNKTMSISKWFI